MTSTMWRVEVDRGDPLELHEQVAGEIPPRDRRRRGEARRGRGITVTGTPERGAVVERARELLHFARTQGYRPDELITIIQQLG
jgi:hypothetical protein